MSNIATDIARRRVWHGARSALRVIRVRVYARGELAERAWNAISDAIEGQEPLAEDWDAGPNAAAFLALAEDGLTDELRAALAAVATAAGVDPDDLGEVADGELALPDGISHFGDGQGGTVILAIDRFSDEALVVEWTQRLPNA